MWGAHDSVHNWWWAVSALLRERKRTRNDEAVVDVRGKAGGGGCFLGSLEFIQGQRLARQGEEGRGRKCKDRSCRLRAPAQGEKVTVVWSHILAIPGLVSLEQCHLECSVEHSSQGHGFRARLPGLQAPVAPFTSWVTLVKLLVLSVPT